MKYQSREYKENRQDSERERDGIWKRPLGLIIIQQQHLQIVFVKYLKLEGRIMKTGNWKMKIENWLSPAYKYQRIIEGYQFEKKNKTKTNEFFT